MQTKKTEKKNFFLSSENETNKKTMINLIRIGQKLQLNWKHLDRCATTSCHSTSIERIHFAAVAYFSLRFAFFFSILFCFYNFVWCFVVFFFIHFLRWIMCFRVKQRRNKSIRMRSSPCSFVFVVVRQATNAIGTTFVAVAKLTATTTQAHRRVGERIRRWNWEGKILCMIESDKEKFLFVCRYFSLCCDSLSHLVHIDRWIIFEKKKNRQKNEAETDEQKTIG